MQIAPLVLPRPIPQQRIRQPKKNIPQTKFERDDLLQIIRHYVKRDAPVPPMPVSELRQHAEKILAAAQVNPLYLDYIGILLNNEMWREPLASIPYERRLLLLPKCLRIESKCPAPFDEFGLLCKQCGLCSIQDLQNEAERLGYAVLVAEGSAIVMSLIQTGKIEAIVGVSCLSVLEKAFPYMEAAAIPGIAIPLLQDDCIDTTVDLDWVWDVIHLTSDDQTRRLDLGTLRDEVDTWFSPESLEETMGPVKNETEQMARDWLSRDGKRWRPFLTVSAFQALRDSPEAEIPCGMRKIAIAIECFHKASLIHDDIEDEDRQRYGEKTLHEEHGVAIALNVGDFMIGEGYRLIGTSQAPPEIIVEMLQVAAEGQRKLCCGQGAELSWTRNPQVLSTLQVLDIFRQKTAPAFEVAIYLGAIYAGKHEEVAENLEAYSEALGIAYQIRDDLDDLENDEEWNDLRSMRPHLLLAIAYDRAKEEKERFLKSVWEKSPQTSVNHEQIQALCMELKADQRARQLLETYKEEAIRSLQDLENANLKGLLRRVIGKIFNDTEIKGWCHEFETRNVTGRTVITEVVG